MAIIKTIKSGNCTIYIDDEYAKTFTPEEKRKKIGKNRGYILRGLEDGKT